MAAPMHWDGPVTTATLPFNFDMLHLLFYVWEGGCLEFFESRIVDVAFRPACVESSPVIRIQWRTQGDAPRQIGICDEQPDRRQRHRHHRVAEELLHPQACTHPRRDSFFPSDAGCGEEGLGGGHFYYFLAILFFFLPLGVEDRTETIFCPFLVI